MADRPELCWYCRTREASAWCDYRLGAVLAPPEGAPAQFVLGEPPRPREVVETCDVASCASCYRRFGWRQIFSAIVCVRGRKGRGCHGESIDHCHLHAAAGTRGTEAWVGAAAVELARAEARTACVRLAGGTVDEP